MNDNETKIISRRDFLRAASLVTAAGVLAACGGQPAAPPAEQPAEKPAEPAAEQPTEAAKEEAGAVAPAAEAITVQYWVAWGNYAAVWDTLKTFDQFKEIVGENVSIEVSGSSGGEKLLTAVAAGTPPDGASNVQYLDYMARDTLVPIDDWIAASTIVKKENYLEGNWNDGFYKGVMYGVPANECFLRYGLNYNARMVEAAGLDPDNPPLTWSECFEWHKALTQFDEAKNLKQIGLDPYDAMGGQIGIQDGFYPPVSWGWKWFDVDTGKFDLDNEMMAEAFEVMGEFYKLAGPDNLAGMRQVEGQGSWGGSYSTEVQAMIIEGYWHPGETVLDKPEVGEHNRATWAPVPDSRKGTKVQGYGGHYVIIFKDSKQKEAMFRVGEFLNINEACDTIFKQVGWLPALIPYLDTVDASTFPGLKFYFDSIKEATEWSSPARCPITAFVSTAYQQLREAQFRDQMTAAEAATEFQKRVEEEWINAGFGG
jgi:multiple sugar transport system substrate-binding protein